MTRKVAEPLEEDSFRPILHHYDGPKFRLELNIPEVKFHFLPLVLNNNISQLSSLVDELTNMCFYISGALAFGHI